MAITNSGIRCRNCGKEINLEDGKCTGCGNHAIKSTGNCSITIKDSNGTITIENK